MEETNVNLKLLIDTESHRVLFAEAGNDFIDFLIHILALPVGTFIPLLKKQGMVGSLGSIYESIESFTIYIPSTRNDNSVVEHCCVKNPIEPRVQGRILKHMHAIDVEQNSSLKNCIFQLGPTTNLG